MNQLYRWMFSHVQINGGALDLGSSVIWRMYRGRADCENRIKELKYDFAAENVNMKGFWATATALNTIMLAYNLMSLLRQA